MPNKNKKASQIKGKGEGTGGRRETGRQHRRAR